MRWNDCQDANVPGRIRELGYTESPCTAGHMGPDGWNVVTAKSVHLILHCAANPSGHFFVGLIWLRQFGSPVSRHQSAPRT